MVSTVSDILKLISLEIECNEEYITKAQKVCDKSSSAKRTSLSCIGWHTYKNSNRLWSIGAAGTFRTSVIFDREKKIGVTVLGNSIGKKGARVHHIAKMLYYELKSRKIDFNKTK